MPKSLFVSGISTDVGKTLVSAILLKATNGSYFKPIQSGVASRDSDVIRDLCFPEKDRSNKNTAYDREDQTKIFPETYLLTQPLSPHASATLDGVYIDTQKILLPKTKNMLIVEGAGGLMVPLNTHETFFDLLKQWNLPVVLVSNFYLGSINHTLLSLEQLHLNGIPIYGIVFNGEKNKTNSTSIEAIENFFLEKPSVKKYEPIKKFFLPQLENINADVISRLALRLKKEWDL